MSNVRDLFASPGSAHLGYSMRREAISEAFVIDGEARTITPPANFKHFGVESDEKTNRIWFEAPQIVGDNIDLATLNLRVNYKNANGEIDGYIVDDVEADGSNIRFSWSLSRKVTKYKGTVSFIVCAVKTSSGGKTENEWNTTLCTGSVLEGLEATSPEVEESTSDLISQLVDMINTATNDVNNAKSEALSDIEDAKEEALSAIGKADTTPFSNSLKATASGEVVRVDDVSPLEHTARAKVYGKNLAQFTESIALDAGMTTVSIPCSAKAPFTLSYNVTAESVQNTSQAFINVLYTDGTNTFDAFESGVGTHTEQITVNNGKQINEIRVINWGNVVGGLNWLQVEEGNTATEYEPFIDPATVTVTVYGDDEADKVQYTPNADGTVDIVSLSPTMTLLTDKAGVNITLEYNQDTNAAMDNVKKDIAELDRMIVEMLGIYTPTRSYINILGGIDNWVVEEVEDNEGNVIGSRYGQVVNVNNAVITPNSKVDMQISSEQMVIFHEKDLAFVAENEGGVVTIYCIGNVPENDYTMQVTVTEVGTNE